MSFSVHRTVVQLQNASAKFCKVVQKYCSGEVETFTFLCNKFTHFIRTSRSGATRWNSSTDRRKVMTVKSIYLQNVVVKQESLIRTQKTHLVTYCPVACNRAPFIYTLLCTNSSMH